MWFINSLSFVWLLASMDPTKANSKYYDPHSFDP